MLRSISCRFSRLNSTSSKAFNEAAKLMSVMNKQKEAELLMIDAEEQSLRQLPSSVDVAQKLNTLAMARKKIIEQIRDLDPNYKAQQTASSRSYDTEILPLMRLNNQQYRKAHGPLLSLKAAKYYKLFGDAIPSKWEHHMQNQDNSINMQVWFGGDERTAPLRGNIISPSQSKAAPNVRFFSDSSSEKLFSLVMLDADVPLPAEQSMMSCPMWIVSNIPVSNQKCATEDGDIILPYTPPHPTRGSGFRRFVWLALEQSDRLEPESIKSSLISAHFDAPRFLENTDFSLRGLAFHRAAWDSEVPLLFSQEKITVPSRVIQANGGDCGGNRNDIQVWRAEPLYGQLISKSWEEVNRNLYRYAFK